jgi:hypothetical protein
MSAIIEQLDMTDLVPPSGVNVEQLHRDLKLQLGEALDGVVYFDEGDGKHGLSVVVRRPFNPEDVRQAAARALEATDPNRKQRPRRCHWRRGLQRWRLRLQRWRLRLRR